MIPTGADYAEVLRILESKNILINKNSFDWTATKMHYDINIKPGRYKLKSGMSNRELVSLLRSGRQTPLQVTFNNIRTIEQFAGRISSLIEADSTSLLKVFKDTAILARNGFNLYNVISILIPNTYEFYWNTTALSFYNRMLTEYKKFWNPSRIAKANEKGLTREQVSIIASIVEQETQKDQEKNIIAGVYINRFKKNWKLEADPTLVFALGDFTIRRVLNDYKTIASPYNTYLNTGLPPGPICIPGIASIDAVLNAASHDYMFFCARDDFSGFHAFARTYEEHLNNARKFQKALNHKGIFG